MHAFAARRRAFTLIELLVVIAIIAILAAILFPVFAQAKQAAKGSACASNIRNLSLAEVLYQNDYEDTFTLAAYGTETSTVLWHDMLDPYVKNKDIWHCPSSSLSKKDTTGAITSHFGYNVAYLTDFQMDFSNANNHRAFGVGSIEKPSETVLFTDARASVKGSWCGDDGKLLLAPSGYYEATEGSGADCWGIPDPLHTNKVTIAWTDTHVSKKAMSGFYEKQDPVDLYFDRE
jgi:prepilin-type N-terminal cleavage/methylation domain-containing protein